MKTFIKFPWFPRFVSFGEYFILTTPLFGQLMAQSLQRNNNSKQQFVLKNLLKLLLFLILNKWLQDYLQVFEMLLLR